MALQVLVFFASIAEIVCVASVIPFMSLIGDADLLHGNSLVAELYEYTGLSSRKSFLLILGAGVLICLILSALVSMLTTWRLSMFAISVGTELSDRLYRHYIRQNWLFHSSESSARLTKKVATESTRVTNQILLPLMHMNARIVLVLLMGISIFLYDPLVALIGLSIIATSYLILFRFVKKKLFTNGVAISTVVEDRFRLMNEGFGGIKDILLLGKQDYYVNRFNEKGRILASSQGVNNALAQVPRYIIELIAFGSMITLLLYLIASHNENLGLVLPVLSAYALAGFKLLPACQQIYASAAQIKGNLSAFSSIQSDLFDSLQVNSPKFDTMEGRRISPAKSIRLTDVNFSYPSSSKQALVDLNLEIQAGACVGIVGASGSGKSTLINLILGLIAPNSGSISVDEVKIGSDNMHCWQAVLGYVPQNIFLSEGSIAENVAFGVDSNSIDKNRLERAIRLAQLADFVDSLDGKTGALVGERGVRLSGGQRQRIGIARALYRDSEVLVFDEATSALDGNTEVEIMKSINEVRDGKTIILVAHRLRTVRDCDQIYFMEQGKVVDHGTYDELLDRNKEFEILAGRA